MCILCTARCKNKLNSIIISLLTGSLARCVRRLRRCCGYLFFAIRPAFSSTLCAHSLDHVVSTLRIKKEKDWGAGTEMESRQKEGGRGEGSREREGEGEGNSRPRSVVDAPGALDAGQLERGAQHGGGDAGAAHQDLAGAGRAVDAPGLKDAAQLRGRFERPCRRVQQLAKRERYRAYPPASARLFVSCSECVGQGRTWDVPRRQSWAASLLSVCIHTLAKPA